MENNQTLELQIQSSASQANNEVQKLVKSLTTTENVLTNIYLQLGSIEKNGLKTTTDKATNSANKLGKALSLGGAYLGIKRLSSTFLNWMGETVDFTEQLNLFNVVFKNIENNGTTMYSKLGQEATKFQYKMNETFGTSKRQTFYMQGMFQSMGENAGIPDTYSAVMSQTMMKLTYDIASLYNKQESVVAEALRAGVYAGQTKPLRAYGIDVTQTSMQPVLESLGIQDRSIKQMSQAEKEIVRYIAALKQGQVAMGDFANNFNSPSNQLKIFKQQLSETKIAITSLFLGTFAKILPWANAILMVIKEVSKAIAGMFGIKVKDFNTGTISVGDSFDGVSDSVGDATKKVKEFKRQALGFDEIHNIDDKKDSGGSGGSSGGISGGIDQRLLDAIKGYDSGLDQVRMKATDIRDRIMEWLGFTKIIDPLTGEVSFKLKEGYSNLKLIGGVIATIVGFKLISGVVSLVKKLLGVDNLLKLSGKNLTIIGKVIKSLKMSGWSATLAKITSKLKPLLISLGKFSIGAAGLAGVIFGSKGTANAMKEMTKQSEYGGKEQIKYTASVLGTVGGATALGAVLGGPLGAAIGGVSGAVIAGTSAILGYKQGLTDLVKENIFGTLSVSTEQWLEILKNSETSITDNTPKFEELKNNLNNLGTTFDNNADKLDFYGLKFGKMAQQISEEDAVNIKSAIEEMGNSSMQIIDETTTFSLEVWGKTFEKMSTITEDEEKAILTTILEYGQEQKEGLHDAQENITKTYDNAIKARGYLTDEEYKYIQEQLAKIRELTENEMTLNQSNVEYYKKHFADKNNALDEQSYRDSQIALEGWSKDRLKTIEENYNVQLNLLNSTYDEGERNTEEYNNALKTLDEQRKEDTTAVYEDLEDATRKIFENLSIVYQESLDDNKGKGKEQRKFIENLLKDLDIDTTSLKNGFSNAGKVAGASFSNSFKPKLNVDFSVDGRATYYNGVKANGGVFANGNWSNIPQYANGGSPSHGTMFVAGEAGAEIVGHINGRTEVLNQSQIASAIYSAVVSAMSQFNGKGQDIRVYAEEGIIVEKVSRGIDQHVNQTGSLPFNIPS